MIWVPNLENSISLRFFVINDTFFLNCPIDDATISLFFFKDSLEFFKLEHLGTIQKGGKQCWLAAASVANDKNSLLEFVLLDFAKCLLKDQLDVLNFELHVLDGFAVRFDHFHGAIMRLLQTLLPLGIVLVAILQLLFSGFRHRVLRLVDVHAFYKLPRDSVIFGTQSAHFLFENAYL